MNTEEYARMFDAEDHHWWYQALHTLGHEALHRYAPQARRIVDVGCGTGAMAAQLATDAWVVGVDRAPEGLACCRQRGLHQVVRGDASHLPLADQAADAALLLDVLYHRGVTDPAAVLVDVRRVLSPKGIVIINVPAYRWLYSSHDVAVHTERRFTRGEVTGLLRDAGFGVLFASYWNSLLFPGIAAVRLARRHSARGGSDVAAVPALTNRALGAVMAAERLCMRRHALPFGVSVFAVGRRET